jgi:hypothetical protein
MILLTLWTLMDCYGSYIGAGNEVRTRDPDLGKVVLYQLSYSRIGKKWCPGRDLNSHDQKGRGILNPLCLPISPPGHLVKMKSVS